MSGTKRKDTKVPPLSLTKKLLLVGGALVTVAIVVLIIVVSIILTSPDDDDLSPQDMVDYALDSMPIIDGHNNFPQNLKKFVYNDLSKVNFSANLNEIAPWGLSPWSQTDLPRLKAGRIGTEFWVARVDCESQHKDAVMQVMEQIDVIKRLINEYENDLQYSTEAADIEDAIENDKIASFIALGGGHAIQSSAALLRMYYELGVRSMSLTDLCSTPWIESSAATESTDPPKSSAVPISIFGSFVIEEMNRLGMIVDASLVSKDGALSVLRQSRAPVIFSHTGASSLCDHHSNLDDEVLELVKEQNGLVMVSTDLHYSECRSTRGTIEDIAEHIEYIRNITSIDNVGIGGNFDGTDRPALGLDDPSKYPQLFLHLAETGRWTRKDLEKLSGRNFLRVFKAVEEVRDSFLSKKPMETTIKRADLISHGVSFECLTNKYRDDDREIKSKSTSKRRIKKYTRIGMNEYL